MKHLPEPIKRVLDVEADEQAIQRMWRAIAAPPRRAPVARMAAYAAGAALTLVVGAVAGRALWPAAPAQERAPAPLVAALGPEAASAAAPVAVPAPSPTLDLAPLRLADGGPLEVLEARPDQERRAVDLSDRSRITLDPGTRLDTLENDGAQVAFHLKLGHGDLAVQPGKRRWFIECGLATVELLGAELSIARTPTALRVAVVSGKVLVRGERVPDRVRSLGSGESIEIADRVHSEVADAGVARATVRRPPVAATVDGTSALDGAPREPVTATVAVPATPTFDELLGAADDARRRGDPRAAAEILERMVASGRTDTLTALASFTLGRIRLLELGEPARARDALELALRSTLPLDLREDAQAYLAQACARAGDRAAARATAAAYLRDHPSGRHAPALRDLTETRE